MSTTTVTYLAAADISANEAAVFPARGEAFPAPNGWTYQGLIGNRALLGEFGTEAEAQAACDTWLGIHVGAQRPKVSLLALHARAISLRGSGRAAWARVEAARAARATTSNGWTPAEHAEDVDLCAAYHDADRVEHDSIADLCAAIRNAEWGQQADVSFVSRSAVTCGGFQQHHTLHAPAKQGPICEVRDHERGYGSSLVALRTREEAREIRAAERCDNRDAERLYASLRRRAGAILRAGGTLPFCTGQEYGFVTFGDKRYVSARGALVAAGLTKDTALAVLETCRESGMLSIRGLTGDPRPLPLNW